MNDSYSAVNGVSEFQRAACCCVYIPYKLLPNCKPEHSIKTCKLIEFRLTKIGPPKQYQSASIVNLEPF